MKGDFRQLIHTPADLAVEHLNWARRNATLPGMSWGISSIDKYVIPMRPGDLTGIIARPGHGKSTLLAYLARTESKRIVERGANDTEAVVYVTWESSAEELENFFAADDTTSASDVAWGRADLDEITRKSVKRASVPIWVIGHGIGRATKNTPRMTVDVVYKAIESMQEDYGVKPVLVLMDYIQLIPVERATERTVQVTEAVIRAKELAQHVAVPITAAVQARREVDSYKQPIPEKADAQWASGIEQTVDKLFSLWRPCLSPGFENALIEIEGVPGSYDVKQTLLIMRMLKQRGEDGRRTWAMYFAPQYLRLCELELQNAEVDTYGNHYSNEM